MVLWYIIPYVKVYIKKNIFSNSAMIEISTYRKTCQCNIYPLSPHFYIEKLGFAGVSIPTFLIFDSKHRLWVLGEAALTCTHNQCFEQIY